MNASRLGRERESDFVRTAPSRRRYLDARGEYRVSGGEDCSQEQCLSQREAQEDVGRSCDKPIAAGMPRPSSRNVLAQARTAKDRWMRSPAPIAARTSATSVSVSAVLSVLRWQRPAARSGTEANPLRQQPWARMSECAQVNRGSHAAPSARTANARKRGVASGIGARSSGGRQLRPSGRKPRPIGPKLASTGLRYRHPLTLSCRANVGGEIRVRMVISRSAET